MDRLMPSAKRPPRIPRAGKSEGSGRSSSRKTHATTSSSISKTNRRRARLLGDSSGPLWYTRTWPIMALAIMGLVMIASYQGMLMQLQDSAAEAQLTDIEDLELGDPIIVSTLSSEADHWDDTTSKESSLVPPANAGAVPGLPGQTPGIANQREGSEPDATPSPASMPQPNQRQDAQPPSSIDNEMENPAVIVFTYNRPHYLRQTLKSLTHVSHLSSFSVYVSLDGGNVEVLAAAQTFGGEGGNGASSRGELAPPYTRAYEVWQHPRDSPALGPHQAGHAWGAQHYKWALDRVFLEKGHSHAILAEDDMLFSIDFLSFFQATHWLLQADPSIWCISSWNDNALRQYTWDDRRMFRTSYFPGLGWMLSRELWLELGPMFPKEHWDHWMRLDTTSKGRECVVPEVNRNFNIGVTGANMEAQTYEKYLSKMVVSHELIREYGDLNYLLKPQYEEWMKGVMANSKHWGAAVTSPDGVLAAMGVDHEGGSVLITYKAEDYSGLASRLGIWPFPRAHHLHVAYLRFKGVLFLIADARFCPYLPSNLRLEPTPSMRPIRADRGVDCIATCAKEAMRCAEQDFWFINTCKILEQHFPCERGCALVLGPDIPNYVEDTSLNTYQQCLVTQEQSKCNARHIGTSRLCACVT